MAPRARPSGPLTLEEAREQIDYDPLTGTCTWKIRKPRIHPGLRAGYVGATGYRQIKICQKQYFEHVFIWFWVMGCWPKDEIDHRNTVRADNRWENLREATRSQNQGNTSRYGKSRGVTKRVSPSTGRTTYRAKGPSGKQGVGICLGEFETEQDALAAWIAYAKLHYGEFYREA